MRVGDRPKKVQKAFDNMSREELVEALKNYDYESNAQEILKSLPKMLYLKLEKIVKNYEIFNYDIYKINYSSLDLERIVYLKKMRFVENISLTRFIKSFEYIVSCIRQDIQKISLI